MILTCEKCNKRYLVKDEEIGPEGRKVRCVACDHTWMHAPMESMMPLKLDPDEILNHPEAVNESAQQSRFRLGWIVFCASIVTIFSGVYFGRHTIVQQWPAIAPVYEAMGLEVSIPGKGLRIENVQPQHTEEDGKTTLVVRGEVVNTSKVAQIIPPLHIQLQGPCEDSSENVCVVKQWEHHFSESRLLPGERIAFETEPKATVPTAKSIHVEF